MGIKLKNVGIDGQLTRPGEYYHDLETGKFVFVEPGGEKISIAVDVPDDSGCTWSMIDENLDSLTLDPSIYVNGLWHGRIQNGELITV